MSSTPVLLGTADMAAAGGFIRQSTQAEEQPAKRRKQEGLAKLPKVIFATRTHSQIAQVRVRVCGGSGLPMDGGRVCPWSGSTAAFATRTHLQVAQVRVRV